MFVVGDRRFIRLRCFRDNQVKRRFVSKPNDLKAMPLEQSSRGLLIRQRFQVKRRVFHQFHDEVSAQRMTDNQSTMLPQQPVDVIQAFWFIHYIGKTSVDEDYVQTVVRKRQVPDIIDGGL